MALAAPPSAERCAFGGDAVLDSDFDRANLIGVDAGLISFGASLAVSSGGPSRDASAVCWLWGEVDISTAPGLVHELGLLVTLGVHHIVVDVGAVTFFGGAGVNLLAQVQRQLGSSGTVTVRQATPTIARLLRLCDMGHLLETAAVNTNHAVADAGDRQLPALLALGKENWNGPAASPVDGGPLAVVDCRRRRDPAVRGRRGLPMPSQHALDRE